MELTTETFLARSREYLLGTDVRPQQSARRDLITRARWPWPSPRRRRAQAAKPRRTGAG